MTELSATATDTTTDLGIADGGGHPSRELAMSGRVAGRRVARPGPAVRSRAGRRVIL